MFLILGMAHAADILVYGPLDYLESSMLSSAGHTVTTWSESQWSSATQSDFEAFDAIVIGDEDCSGPETADWDAIYNNRTTWSPAVTGNVFVTTADAGCHANQTSARDFLVHAVEWAADGGGTGLYVSSDWGRRDFDFLDQFGSWGTTQQHSNSSSITDSSHPHWTGTYGTITSIGGWGNTYHAYFDSYPSDFDVTATNGSNAIIVVREGCDGDLDGYDSSLGSCGGSDCDDTDATVYPSATELCDGQDNDCDGSLDASETDDDSDGYVECTEDSGGWDGSTTPGFEDCDDTDDTIYPSATELCDGQDNDCDGSVPSDETDDDGDGYAECTEDSGGWDGDSSVTGFEDCDDTDDSIYPSATELCDGQDNDCNSSVPSDEVDDDLDGYVDCTLDSAGWDGASISGGDDCDDTDSTVYPTAPDLCDGLDNDCDGSLESIESDLDGDGYVECAFDPNGWDGPAVTGELDCDDSDPTIYPTATELCDGQDNDCDSAVGIGETDDDGDGFVECTVDSDGWDGDTITGGDDCDDADASIYPGAPEVAYDAIDQDCNGEDLCDVDGDGFDYDGAECYGDDCDDDDAEINVDAEERWYDDIDQDCDGGSDFDSDGDGHDSASYGGDDCDDANPDAYPGAPDEPGDGIITDCDAADEYDADGDGFDGAEYGGSDCDDANSEINPGADETWYDGVDSDCDEASDFDQDGDGYDSAEYGGDDCDDLNPNVFLCDTGFDDTGLDGAGYKGGGGCGQSSTLPVAPAGSAVLLGLLGLVGLTRRR